MGRTNEFNEIEIRGLFLQNLWKIASFAECRIEQQAACHPIISFGVTIGGKERKTETNTKTKTKTNSKTNTF